MKLGKIVQICYAILSLIFLIIAGFTLNYDVPLENPYFIWGIICFLVYRDSVNTEKIEELNKKIGVNECHGM
jgi:hypothetical protein